MLEILSNISIYVKVSVINNMSKYNGNKMVSWDLQGGVPSEIQGGYGYSAESLHTKIPKCTGTASYGYL